MYDHSYINCKASQPDTLQAGGSMTRPGTGRPARAAQPLDRQSPMPLWAQLLADLRRRLRAGAFGDAFPGELALVADYRVSRQTVRAALRELRAEGVVVAERGRRPRLAGQPAITQPLGALYSLFASVEAAGLRQTSIVRARDLRADGVIADRLGLEASTPLFRLERLRLAGGEPLALDTVWLPADLGAPLLAGGSQSHQPLRRARRPHRRPAGRRPRAYPRRGADPRRTAPPPDHAHDGSAGDRPARLRGRPAGGVAAHPDPGRPVLPARRVLPAHRVPPHARRARASPGAGAFPPQQAAGLLGDHPAAAISCRPLRTRYSDRQPDAAASWRWGEIESATQWQSGS